jgi:D-alanine-D-alanine ligase
MSRIKIGLLSKKRGNYKLQQKFAGKGNVKDETAKEVAHHRDALLDVGYDVEVIQWDSNFIRNVKRAQVSLVFNVSSLVEAAILEESGIPFVGSGTTGIKLAADKSVAKRLWQQVNIPTSAFVVLRSLDDCRNFISDPSIPYPLFIKPVAGRGSAGINKDSFIQNGKQLLKAYKKLARTIGQPVLVERYLQGREITIGVIGNKKHIRILPPLEIKYNDGGKFLTFNKKEADSDRFSCPADIAPNERRKLQDFVAKAFRTIQLRDFARFDTKLTDEGFMLIEANSFAGLMCTPKEKPHSYIGFMARAENHGGKELIKEIVDTALERINNKRSNLSPGSDQAR